MSIEPRAMIRPEVKKMQKETGVTINKIMGAESDLKRADYIYQVCDWILENVYHEDDNPQIQAMTNPEAMTLAMEVYGLTFGTETEVKNSSMSGDGQENDINSANPV